MMAFFKRILSSMGLNCCNNVERTVIEESKNEISFDENNIKNEKEDKNKQKEEAQTEINKILTVLFPEPRQEQQKKELAEQAAVFLKSKESITEAIEDVKKDLTKEPLLLEDPNGSQWTDFYNRPKRVTQYIQFTGPGYRKEEFTIKKCNCNDQKHEEQKKAKILLYYIHRKTLINTSQDAERRFQEQYLKQILITSLKSDECDNQNKNWNDEIENLELKKILFDTQQVTQRAYSQYQFNPTNTINNRDFQNFANMLNVSVIFDDNNYSDKNTIKFRPIKNKATIYNNINNGYNNSYSNSNS